MKVIILCLMCLLCVASFSQISDTIELSFTKSAYLVFKPGAVVKFDCGSEDVFVRSSENKVILQAGVEEFEETNLFVQSGNDIFLFIVKYNVLPKKYLYDYGNNRIVSESNEVSDVVNLLQNPVNNSAVAKINTEVEDQLELSFKTNCEKLLNQRESITNRGVVKYKVSLLLKSIAISDDKIYLRFNIKNTSNIPYNIDYMEYAVRSSKRRIKGESFQEIELKALYEHARPKVIEGKSSYNFVIVLDKFVLTQNKKLVIEYWENNGEDMSIEGGRKISFELFSYDILNIRRL